MAQIAMAIFVVFVLLLLSEWMWRRNILRGEAARKSVHLVIGSFVAFWPYFMDFRAIQAISLAFLVVVLLSQKYSIFNAIHGVGRKTWGEVLFAVGVGLAATLTTSKGIFTAAILHLSLADGLAGIIGCSLGKNNSYKVGSQTKSLAGSFAFWLASFSIIALTVSLDPSLGAVALPLLFWLPLMATFTENIGIWGTDNVLVPLLIIAALSSLQLVV